MLLLTPLANITYTPADLHCPSRPPLYCQIPGASIALTYDHRRAQLLLLQRLYHHYRLRSLFDCRETRRKRDWERQYEPDSV